MSFEQYRNYYLIKAFGNKQHRDDFNTGKEIYINSVEFFHNHGNLFQGDFEGGIVQQPDNSPGKLIFTKEHQSLEQIVNNYRSNQYSADDYVVDTNGFKAFISGHICCFALFPKSSLVFCDNQIVFNENDATIQKEFYNYLNGYAQEKGYTFFSVYDAEAFLQLFCEGMMEKGYALCYGPVDYHSMTAEERIWNYQHGNIQSIVFTKDSRFAYQKEFRVFLQSHNHKNVPIKESGIDFRSSIVCSLAYLTPEYYKSISNHTAE